MRVHVAFTPSEEVRAPVGIVVDVLARDVDDRQALAAGYERVLCCAEVEEARALAAAKRRGARAASAAQSGSTASTSATRRASSPTQPTADTLVLTTTNGTRLLLAAAARCETVLVGSLLNLDAVVAAARERAEEVAVLCAGVDGELALDDAYCAGRIAEALGGEPLDSAKAAIRLAQSFGSHQDGLDSARAPRTCVTWSRRGHRLLRPRERARRRAAARPHGRVRRRGRRRLKAALVRFNARPFASGPPVAPRAVSRLLADCDRTIGDGFIVTGAVDIPGKELTCAG